MAIDTAAKRSSCLDFEEVWTSGTPLPTGTIDQAERQHALWSYSGILMTEIALVGIVALTTRARPVATTSQARIPTTTGARGADLTVKDR